MLAASERVRQVFTVVYLRSADVVGDEDVALPAIDLGRERPTAIAGNGEKARDTVARDAEGKLAQSMDAAVGKTVEVQRVHGASCRPDARVPVTKTMPRSLTSHVPRRDAGMTTVSAASQGPL